MCKGNAFNRRAGWSFVFDRDLAGVEILVVADCILQCHSSIKIAEHAALAWLHPGARALPSCL